MKHSPVLDNWNTRRCYEQMINEVVGGYSVLGWCDARVLLQVQSAREYLGRLDRRRRDALDNVRPKDMVRAARRLDDAARAHLDEARVPVVLVRLERRQEHRAVLPPPRRVIAVDEVAEDVTVGDD